MGVIKRHKTVLSKELRARIKVLAKEALEELEKRQERGELPCVERSPAYIKKVARSLKIKVSR